jgi:hypothetical protein
VEKFVEEEKTSSPMGKAKAPAKKVAKAKPAAKKLAVTAKPAKKKKK